MQDKKKIRVTVFEGVCNKMIRLNNIDVPLTAEPNGQMDGETLFKLEIFSLVWFLII